MQLKILMVGGGIGGLAAAVAAREAGCVVSVVDKTDQFAEVGAGIQLGPNVTRHLQRWHLQSALDAVAAFPEQVVVRSATSGHVLATMPLGKDFVRRYGAPYVTLHRADLHHLLLDAAQARGSAVLTGHGVSSVEPLQGGVQARCGNALQSHHMPEEPVSNLLSADILIGADGVWSAMRRWVPQAQPPVFTGHIAYRMLVDQRQLVASMRLTDVVVWLGPRLHVVMYPVRAGEALNVVLICHGAVVSGSSTSPQQPPTAPTWMGDATAPQVTTAVARMCSLLQDSVQSVVAASTQIGCWPLYASKPLQSAQEMVHGRIALLGDAAHPMLPYLAQGAGMAIEDAVQLGRSLSLTHLDAPSRLQHYAQQRYARNAAVQSRAVRNGRIFQMGGISAVMRNTALRCLGARMMDMPWLYAGGPSMSDV